MIHSTKKEKHFSHRNQWLRAAVLGANYPGSKWYERSYKLIQRHAPAAAPQS